MATTITPTGGPFAPFVPPGPGNCRYGNLAPFAGYDCTTPRHTVTEAELADGFFRPVTTWTVSGTGLTAATIEVDGGEVDLVGRDPRLSESLTGTWNDTNGNGIANVGDTITWVGTVVNAGNVRITSVVANGKPIADLAVEDSATALAETIPLTAADLEAGTVEIPTLDVSGSNGTLAASVDEVATAPTIPFAGAWDKAAVYTKGQTVTFAGHLWLASWWTKSQAPGDPAGPWQQIATNASGTALWTPTRIFEKGDVAVHDGTTHTARWWNRNQQPGAAWGPWQLRTAT